MGKKFFVLGIFLVLLVGIQFAVDAPIQDVFNFDVRASLSAQGVTDPELFDLIQAAVANNIDPSVEIANFASRLSVVWQPNGNITALELAVMAVKLLGREGEALRLYPLSSPTLKNIQPIPGTGVGQLFYQRAFGYAEYYHKFLRTEYPELMNLVNLQVGNQVVSSTPIQVLKNPAGAVTYQIEDVNEIKQVDTGVRLNRAFTRYEVLEFLVRLAYVYFDKTGMDYFNSLTVETELEKVVGKNPNIVVFSEKLSDHLRTMYGANLPPNVGFLYAFEFYFLTDQTRIAVPVIYLNIFKNAFNAGIFTNITTRNIVLNGATDPAERYWTVALFSKIFSTEIVKVEKGIRAPERILNNVVSYKPVENFKGQLMFNNVKCIDGQMDPYAKRECLGLNAVFFKLDNNKEYVILDASLDMTNPSNFGNGRGFYGSLPNPGTPTSPLKAFGVGTVNADGQLSLKVQNIIFASNTTAPYTTIQQTTFASAVTKNIVEEEISEIDLFRVYFPMMNDFIYSTNPLTQPVDLFESIVNNIINSDLGQPNEFNNYVNERKWAVSNMLQGENVIFDINFPNPLNPAYFVELLPAVDRLNHTSKVLTLGAIQTFVNMYNDTHDQIDGNNNTPNLQYYLQLLSYAREVGYSEDTVVVAMFKWSSRLNVEISNFRMIDQVLGEVQSLEVLDCSCYNLENCIATDTLLGYTVVGGSSVVNCFADGGTTTNMTALNGNLPCPLTGTTTDCVENPGCNVVGSTQLVGTPLASDCSWEVQFDNYFSRFVYPRDLRLAMFDPEYIKSVDEDYNMLLAEVLGFKGPKVNSYYVVRSINPLDLSVNKVPAVLKIYK